MSGHSGSIYKPLSVKAETAYINKSIPQRGNTSINGWKGNLHKLIISRVIMHGSECKIRKIITYDWIFINDYYCSIILLNLKYCLSIL